MRAGRKKGARPGEEVLVSTAAEASVERKKGVRRGVAYASRLVDE